MAVVNGVLWLIKMAIRGVVFAIFFFMVGLILFTLSPVLLPLWAFGEFDKEPETKQPAVIPGQLALTYQPAVSVDFKRN